MADCVYCGKEENEQFESYLICEECNQKVHLKCLRNGGVPGSLHGDVFFKFKCESCNWGREEFRREKLQWVNVLILTLYNLHYTSEGVSNHGYFHWKLHICNFIESHWTALFGKTVKKKRNWMGTVSGTLSHHSPAFFRSGIDDVREGGWWKLAVNQKPQFLLKHCAQLSVEKKRKPQNRLYDLAPPSQSETGSGASSHDSSPRTSRTSYLANQRTINLMKNFFTEPPDDSSVSTYDDTSSVVSSSSGRVSIVDNTAFKVNNMFSRAYTEPTETLSECLFANEDKDCSDVDIDVDKDAVDISGMRGQTFPDLRDVMQRQRVEKILPDESSVSTYDDNSSVELNNMESERETGTSSSSGRVSAVDSSACASFKANDIFSRAYAEPSETLSECLFANDDDECSDVDIDVDKGGVDISCIRQQAFPDLQEVILHQREEKISRVEAPTIKEEQIEYEESFVKEEDVVKEEFTAEDENITESEVRVSQKSLFPVETLLNVKKSDISLPDVLECYSNRQARCLPMSEYEELKLLNQLRAVPTMNDVPGAVRRLYRKLQVRKLKRERGMPLFNFDDVGAKKGETKWDISRLQSRNGPVPGDVRILDRFQHVHTSSLEGKSNCRFIMRLMGQIEPSCFYSPYTQRLLKPFIRRDSETTPLWLRLLDEIQTKVNSKNPDWHLPPRHPIDYSYVRPQHISSVNSLCREFFYPGIDLTECLQYPDFSCVVLYKKLVVGFAFMVPDVGLNEAYISFLFTRPEWRRAGIATFMLYHLIQTCMGKDLTLHVSVTNPALILYQKFGFKVEEFVQDFYDKYFPADSKECKHAFFLRLSR